MEEHLLHPEDKHFFSGKDYRVFSKLKHFWKHLKYKKIIVPIFVIAAIALLFYGNGNGKAIQTFAVARGDVAQEVVVSGRVQAVESVDLAFEASGKVSQKFVEVGDRVTSGQLLAALNRDDYLADLKQANARVDLASSKLSAYQAALEQEEAELADLKNVRPEDVRIKKLDEENAKRYLAEQEDNLAKATQEAETDLQEKYNDAYTALFPAAAAAKDALVNLSDLQYSYFSQTDDDGVRLESAKEEAISALFDQSGGGTLSAVWLSKLDGGVYGQVRDLTADVGFDAIDHSLTELLFALNQVKAALQSVAILSSMSATDRTTLSTDKDDIGDFITDLSSKQKVITTQKSESATIISTKKSAVTKAQNDLFAASEQLRLTKAGATDEQIDAKEAAVRQAKANLSAQYAQVNEERGKVQNIQAKLNQRVLTAPITGIVTKGELEVGEIVPANAVVISIISEGQFEIESDVPEVEIAKIQVGNSASVYLDAYGEEVRFDAVVTEVDPAETVIDGVSHYKVTLQFKEEDDRIRSGMTANIELLTQKHQDVLYVHERAIARQDGENVVYVTSARAGSFELRPVTLGLKGSSGLVEVMSGLKEGEIVLLDPEL
ncbi:MAG: efflux RND transporter periplasmic adaptor subunit [Candidatus Peregrinibacteria bacterium]